MKDYLKTRDEEDRFKRSGLAVLFLGFFVIIFSSFTTVKGGKINLLLSAF